MINILVICTGNSCRSIIGEALFNHFGQGRIQAFSAGSKAKGRVNSQAIALLKRHGVDTEGLFSKSWDSLNTQRFDIMISVCDRAAGETCPSYLSSSLKVHWGIIELSHVKGGDAAVFTAFEETYQVFRQRITKILALPLHEISTEDLQAELNAIG